MDVMMMMNAFTIRFRCSAVAKQAESESRRYFLCNYSAAAEEVQKDSAQENGETQGPFKTFVVSPSLFYKIFLYLNISILNTIYCYKFCHFQAENCKNAEILSGRFAEKLRNSCEKFCPEKESVELLQKLNEKLSQASASKEGFSSFLASLIS